MAAKKNPFVAFEKSKKDKDTKAAKKYGKEGSRKEEKFDKTQSLKCGGMVGKKK